MKKLKFNYYNKSEFKDFLNSLPSKDRYKLLLTISDIEDMGLQVASRMKWTKKLQTNLYEIRSRRAKNYQRCLYFHVINNQYLITNYFTKKSNQTPRREIRTATNRRNKYLKKGDRNE